jgi:hypothetical protein
MRTRICVLFGVVALCWGAFAQPSNLILKRAWVNKYANRATINGKMYVDHALHSPKKPDPKKPANDGDIHAAGRSPQVGLPMVAEVMNAADSKSSAVALVKAQEGTQKLVDVTGVWRLWFEHPPSGRTQTQDFSRLVAAGNTNPDHCFEIHPIVSFNHQQLNATFHSIKGYKPKDAKEAFGRYENLRLSLRANQTSVTLSSSMIGYNYVRFKMRLAGNVQPLRANDDGSSDGLQATMDVYEVDADDGDPPLATGVRAVFVNDTAPAAATKDLGPADELVVLGMPRVDLNKVNAYLTAGGNVATNRKLPYEIVIVAVETD